MMSLNKWKYYSNGKYEYNTDNNLVFKGNINKDPKIKDNEAIKLLKINGYEPLERKEIPFTLFYINPLKTCDLELINGDCFELLNRDIKVLLENGFLLALVKSINSAN